MIKLKPLILAIFMSLAACDQTDLESIGGTEHVEDVSSSGAPAAINLDTTGSVNTGSEISIEGVDQTETAQSAKDAGTKSASPEAAGINDRYSYETEELVEEIKLESEGQPEAINSFLPMAFLILSIATLISIAVSFWLYRWRSLLLGKLKVLSPEEYSHHATSMVDIISRLTVQVDYSLDKVNREVSNLTSNSENMTETYMSLHHSIDAKDKEIARLKAGYDSQIYKKFIKRFLKVDQVIQEEILESNSTIASHLESIQEMLQDALDECGVEKFSPEIGRQYKDTEGVADRPEIKETDDAKKNGVISRVIVPGYQLRVNEGFEVIVAAKVEIYHFNESGE